MANDFVTYQKFTDLDFAKKLVDTFSKYEIPYELEDCSLSFDATFANNELAKDYRVKIAKHDFERADEILIRISLEDIKNLDDDYYLFSFTNEELMEIVEKPDEWNHLDYALALQMLKKRGKEVKQEKIQALKQERLKQLAKPENSGRGMVLAGYIFALMGGLFGVVIGITLMTSKKTLPNGERVYVYTEANKRDGRNIFLIGIIMFILIIILQLTNVL